jgi:hypothetical protein
MAMVTTGPVGKPIGGDKNGRCARHGTTRGM